MRRTFALSTFVSMDMTIFRLSVSISGFSIISNRVCKNEGRGRRVEGEHRDVGQVVPVLLRSPQSRHSEHAR